MAAKGVMNQAGWDAARYRPDADIAVAWGRLMAFAAWAAAVPAFALLLWNTASFLSHPPGSSKAQIVFFFNDYLASVGVGIAALFCAVGMSRVRRVDLGILFGLCAAATLLLYVPSLLRNWAALRSRIPDAPAIIAFPFPIALVLFAGLSAALGRRRKAPWTSTAPSSKP